MYKIVQGKHPVTKAFTSFWERGWRGVSLYCWPKMNPESEKCLLVESGIQVVLTKDPESTPWNPESKTVLDFLSYGEKYRNKNFENKALHA